MSRFSETLMDHFQEPRNMGRLKDPDIIGVAGNPGRGRYLVLYLQLREGHVRTASFECNGCGVTIACGSALTELLIGRSLAELERLVPSDLDRALDGLPADKQDRAAFAITALRDAIGHWSSGATEAPSTHS